MANDQPAPEVEGSPAVADDDDIFDVPPQVSGEDEDDEDEEEEVATCAARPEEPEPESDQEEKKEEEEGEGDAADDDGKKKKKKKRLDWTRKIETLYFDVYRAGKCVEQMPMGTKKKILIGRIKGAEILLHNPSISRKHAAICVGTAPDAPTTAQNGITLIDLRANNGTYYSLSWPCRPKNRIKLSKGASAVLKEGFCFRFGESSQSFVVRGLAPATQVKDKNPNFCKPTDKDVGRDNALGRDLGLETNVKKRGHGALITSNPFRGGPEISSATQYLASVNDSKSELSQKILSGGTTFSFHKRQKTEIESIKFEHEKKMRKRVLELKKSEADAREALDMCDK